MCVSLVRSCLRNSGTNRRSKTTIYLRGDLKLTARQASIGAGLPLSRYIETLLIGELAAVNGQVAYRSVSPSHFDIRSQKASTPDHQNPAL